MKRAIRCDAHGLTDVGRVRRTNQDHFLIGDIGRVLNVTASSLSVPSSSVLASCSPGNLLVVADGVGGTVGGGRASSLAVDGIVASIIETMPCCCGWNPETDGRFLEQVRSLVGSSHASVLAGAADEPTNSGMATTVTVACVFWPVAYVAHVGDSRCYLIRDGEPSCVTRDQTIAQEMVDSGALAAEAAERSPWNHVLVSAVGTPARDPEVLLYDVKLQRGDTLLLCTDGLTKHVSDRQIAELLASADSAETASHRLVDAALDAGGTDNVTVVVGRFD